MAWWYYLITGGAHAVPRKDLKMLGGREIRIQIDGGKDQIFYPGAVIRGQVVYKVSTNDRLQSVTLDLRGTEKVLGGKSSPFKSPESVEVFHIHEKLQKSPTWTQKKQMTWSFSMTLPLLTGPDRSDPALFYGNDPETSLFDTKRHPLAATLRKEHSQGVRVEYQMYAIAMYGMKNFGAAVGEASESSICHVIDTLNYTPDTQVLTNNEASFTEVAQSIRSGKPRSGILGIRRGSKTSFDSTISGEIVLRVPTHLIVGDATKLVFTLREVSSDLNCTLKQSTIILRSRTLRRTKDHPYHPSNTEIKDYKIAVDASPCLLTFGLIERSYSTKSVKSCPPSFKSYSIARSYQLLVQAIIITGQGKEKSEDLIEFTTDVTLLRKIDEQERSRRQQADLPPVLEAHELPVEEDVLPTYDMHGEGRLISRGALPEDGATNENLVTMRTISRSHT